MMYVSGTLYHEGTFIDGYVGCENGVIAEIARGAPPAEPSARGFIIPSFSNAHTHIGDAVVRARVVAGSIEELVAPPDGLKHRVLRETAPEKISAAMHGALREMIASGTAQFCDFREQGIDGIRQLEDAAAALPIASTIFGRPHTMHYDSDEVDAILDRAAGIGLSSISDWDAGEMKAIVRHAHRRKKRCAIHVSERIRENIDDVLDLKPDLLIHLIHATDDDLEKIADADIAVAVCPRSNAFFGMLPDIPRLLHHGIRVFLGTDNVMLASPDLFREMEFAYRSARLLPSHAERPLTPDDIYRMTCFSPEQRTGDEMPALVEGAPARFCVLRQQVENPVKTLVTDAGTSTVALHVIGETVWK